MARQYFRKKDPSAQIPEWIEMNGREFYRFTKSPEGRGRYFIDMDDVVIEASKAEYEEWHREKALRDYWEKKAQEDKLTILSLHSDAITENGTGEDVIPDDKVNVEEESILRTEVKELYSALALLDAASCQLIYDLYLAKERKTLRKLSQESNIPVMTLQDRKKKILLWLKKELSRKNHQKNFRTRSQKFCNRK